MEASTSEFLLGLIGVALVLFGGFVMFNDKFLSRTKACGKVSGLNRLDLGFLKRTVLAYGRGAGAMAAGLILIALIILKHFK